MNKCWLLIGGNIGDRMVYLNKAEAKIESLSKAPITVSKTYESEAWGLENQNSFLNRIIILKTQYTANELLKKCLDIEKSLGRTRISKWSERTIDIDILYFENDVVKNQQLTIPHPEIQNRRFVLQPLCELSADHIHPVFQQTNAQLLEKCADQLKVWEHV